MRWAAQDYETDLQRGLALSGEGADYFAASRVRQVQRFCLARGLRPRRVLEFGCGTGTNLRFLREAFPRAQLLGYDPSGEMVQQAKGRQISGLVLSDRLPDRSADLVLMNGGMHHVAPADRPGVFAQLRRCTGGILAAFDNNPLNPGAMWVMRRIPFDREAQPLRAKSMAGLATAAGFRVVDVRSYFYFPKWLGALRHLEPHLSALPFGAQYAVFCVPAP